MNYEIKGGQLPVVICTLNEGETIVCESGAMSWMSANFTNEAKVGGFGKMLGRAMTGESVALNHYTAQGAPGLIAFSSNVPGDIRALKVDAEHSYICQKGSFLAAEEGVTLSTKFQSKIGAGFLGGEGFLMQQLSGEGTAFVEVDGSVIEYELEAGQTMIISTGYLAMMDSTVTMSVKKVEGGLKNMILGGEGFVHTTVTGPGHIWVQTMPAAAIARALSKLTPSKK